MALIEVLNNMLSSNRAARREAEDRIANFEKSISANRDSIRKLDVDIAEITRAITALGGEVKKEEDKQS